MGLVFLATFASAENWRIIARNRVYNKRNPSGCFPEILLSNAVQMCRWVGEEVVWKTGVFIILIEHTKNPASGHMSTESGVSCLLVIVKLIFEYAGIIS